MWGILPIVLGFVSFYFLTSVIIPHFRGGGSHGYIGYYAQFGKTPMQVIFSILTHPWKLFAYFHDALIKRWLFELLAPLAFLPILSRHILFLISPIFIQHLLSCAFQEQTIHYQYALSLAPFIFIATV